MKAAIQQLLLAFSLFLFGGNAFTQHIDTLQQKLQELVKNKKALVCVSIMNEKGKSIASLNENNHCTLHSVFKFHIALTMIAEIDKGRFSLDQLITIQKNELLPGMWSPLRDQYPEGGIIPISKLIQFASSLSDNVACDVLLRLLGGPKTVEIFLKKSGIKDISIRHNEEEINLNNELTYFNWTSAKAANKTLFKFFENKKELLSKESYDFIWKAMKETETGGNRLKGQLPEGTIVAHKTGSSGTDEVGMTLGTNDIGIVFLPDGRYYYISVFVSQSQENEDVNERIIADISRLAFDHFVSQSTKNK